MKTYWDLSEKERAALAREDVEKFIDAELMTKGVLRPTPPVLEKLETPELSTEKFYRVGGGRYGTLLPLAFKTERDVARFLELDVVRVENDWQVNREVEYVEPLNDRKVTIVELPSRADVVASAAEFRKANATKDENEKRENEYREAMRKVDAVLSGLWEDWYACGAKATRVAQVQSTYDEYVEMCGGDRALARKFLRKAFGAERLDEYGEWHGVEMFVEQAEPVEAETEHVQ